MTSDSKDTSRLFVVSDFWRTAHPGASAGILVMRNVANPDRHPGLERRKAELEAQLRTRFAGQDAAALKALDPIQSYDAYLRRYKKTYHVLLQLESVALKGKSIPSVASLVEAMFVAELKNLLLTAGHDLAALQVPVALSVSNGSERYVRLNGQEQQLKPDDMMMSDCQGIISTVLYGPDSRTRITPETRDVLFAVYAPVGIDPQAVYRHLHDIRTNVLLFASEAEVELLEVYGTGVTFPFADATADTGG